MTIDKPALRAVLIYAVCGMAWILFSDRILLQLAPDILVFSLIGLWKGLAFILVTAFALYLRLRRPVEQRVVGLQIPPAGAKPRILSFVLLAVIVVTASLGGVAHFAVQQKERGSGRLQAIGNLKAGQIDSWLAERYADAEGLRSDETLAELYQSGDAASRRKLLKRLDGYRRAFHYEHILLIDDRGDIVLTSGQTPHPDSPPIRDAAKRAFAEDRVINTDLYRLSGSEEVHMEFVAPLPVAAGQRRLAVALNTDPDRFLFPFIQSWPIPTATAETMLFRRDGDEVLFLNELRHQPDTALKLHYPLSRTSLLAVQAIDGGARPGGVVEGVDYRGVAVLGVIRAIPGTPWFLVAKIDKDELYAQTRRDAGWVMFGGTLALVLLAAGATLLRQRRELNFARMQRQQQAEKLRALQLLDAIAETSTDAIFVKDVAGCYQLINPAAAALVGKTREEILGKDDSAIFPHEAAERIRAIDREVLCGNKTKAYENNLPTPAGVRTLLETKGPLRNEHGEVVGLFGIARDVTEFKKAESAIRESELHYRSLFNHMLEGLADCRVVYQNGVLQDIILNNVNESFKQLTGLEDVTGKLASEVIPGLWSGSPELLETLGRVATGGQSERFEIYVDAMAKWLFISAFSMGKDSFVAIFDDITERKRVEEKMRQAAMVFESTRDGIAITDLSGRIQAINRAFTEVTGYTEAEVLGNNPRLLNSGQQGPEFYRNLWSAVLETGSWQGEIWNRRKNGTTYPELLTISTIRDLQGKPTHYVGVFTDISQLWRSKEELVHLAHYDPLTELPNRLLAQSRLERALERAQRHDHRVGVLYLDLDHFKTVNDSLGHNAGDELLIAVARRLKARLREEDTLGRLGGDEFMIVLESINGPHEAAGVARDMLAVLEEPFALPSGQEVYASASIGISLFPEDGDTPADLLRDADAAMYQAKNNGRSQFCFYTGDMNIDALARLELEAALRRALERNELLLHYQAKVDLKTGRICGAEALIRWQRESMGLVPPAQFIPLAEKSDLIVLIGNWVINTACRQIRTWLDAGLPDVHVAVNISARQFRSGQLDEIVVAALQRHGVAADRLELEVTESMLMERPDEAIVMLKKLKKIGVKLSLDDFGTGYSSLTYLMRFPIDNLKIDQSFVRDIVFDPDAAAIAVSIIGLAHRMRLKVVAEGVETEGQLGYLRMRGCDEMQGFYFSQPVSADEFFILMESGKALPSVEPDVAGLRTLLIVDDEVDVQSALRRALRADGYRILSAGSASEALEILARNAVHVILSDQRMPGMSGTEFLRRVKDLYPNTVRIVLSGYTDLESITQAVNEGALYKFVTKPWDNELLRRHVNDAFRYYEAVIRPAIIPQ